MVANIKNRSQNRPTPPIFAIQGSQMLANIWTHICNMKRIFAFIWRRPHVQYIKQYGISFEEVD